MAVDRGKELEYILVVLLYFIGKGDEDIGVQDGAGAVTGLSGLLR